MPNLFADLIPQKQDDFFGDLVPKASFGNVKGGSSSSPSFAGVQSGSVTTQAKSFAPFGVEEGEGITGGDIGQAIAELPNAAYQGLKKGSGALGKTLGLAAGGAAGLFDDLVGTNTQDAVFKNVVEPYDVQEQQTGQELSKMRLPGQIVGGVASAVPDVALGLASGGEALIPRAAPLAESLFQHASRMVMDAGEQGLRMSAPLAEKAAGDAYSNRIAQGGTVAEATGDALKAIASTSLFGVTGQAAYGNVASRIAQGAAAGAATGEAVRELEGREFNPVELGVNAAMGGAFAVHGDAPRSSREAIRGDRDVPPMEGSGPPVETPPRASTEPTEAFQRAVEDSTPTDVQELHAGDLTPEELAAFRKQSLDEPKEVSPEDLTPEERQAFGMFDDLIENNASGESSTSKEAIDRFKLEQANGQHRMILNRDGSVTPIVTADGVDYAAKEGQIIVQANIGDKPWTIIDHGDVPKGIAEGRVNAAKDALDRAALERTTPDEEITLSSEEPLYHASLSPDIQKFDVARSGSQSDTGVFGKAAAYLTGDERLAPFYLGARKKEATLYQVEHSLKNPKEFSSPQEAVQWQGERGTDSPEAAERVRQKYLEAGHDGVVIRNPSTGRVMEAAVFDPDALRIKGKRPVDSKEPFTPNSEARTTSTKNAVMEAERTAEGRDPIIKEAAKDNETSVREAQDELARNPEVVDRIVDRLTQEGPKAVSTKDEAILLVEKTRLRNAREEAAKRASDPNASEEQKAQAKAEWNTLESKINNIDQATSASGTEWGRFGQLRQRQMREDFSLAAMESRERVARGRPLNEKEAAQLKEQAAKIQQLQEALDKGKAANTIDSKEAFNQLAKELSAQLRTPSKRPWLETMKANAEESKKALESMFRRASAGVDPTAFIHLARIGAYHIADGAVKFSDFVGRMKADLGDRFDDFAGSMKDIYAAAKLTKDAGKMGKRATTDADYQQKAEKSLLKRIAVLQDRIAKGDYTKTPRIERELNKRNLELSYQLSKLKQEFGERQFEIEQSKRPTVKKLFGNTRESLNLARAIMTSFDLSAVLRQGGFVALGRPILAAKSVVPMLKAFANEKNAFKVQEEIAHRPNARLYEKSGLELTKANDHHLTKLEEQYMSRWISKLPRVLGGGLVRGSERAFKTFLNKLRADTFDALAGSLSKTGQPTLEEAKAIANYINIATGRGKIGVKGSGAVGLNTLFFAPRLVASRFNLLAGQPLYGGTARTRKMIATEYARFVAGLSVVYALGALAHQAAGEKDKFVETDPRSSNFGKMKFGNTYIDPLAGLGQVTTLIGRELSGETKTQKGQINPLRKEYKLTNLGRDKPDYREPGYGKPTAADVALNFARTKLAPVPGALLNVAAGKNVIGQPTDPLKEAKQLATPLSFQNVEGVLKENGIAGGSAITLLELLGMGVQYRDPNQKWK